MNDSLQNAWHPPCEMLPPNTSHARQKIEHGIGDWLTIR
jgi:hypothetical protein